MAQTLRWTHVLVPCVGAVVLRNVVNGGYIVCHLCENEPTVKNHGDTAAMKERPPR